MHSNHITYNNFGTFLRNKFKKRIFKLSINAGFSCPNLDGTISKGGCIFCNNAAFATDTFKQDINITQQLKTNSIAMKKRYKAQAFIAYFQHYTNTYAKDDILIKSYNEAINFPSVMGISVGTRPDCVSDNILDYLNDIGNEKYVWMEYGLQSIHEKTLKKINRGHDFNTFLETFKRTKKRKNINICVHVIHGLPGEDKKMMMETIKTLSGLHIDGIKIHQMHVVEGTELEELYNKGKIILPSLEEYLDLAATSIQYLHKDILIHRLFGVSSNDMLVAPKWGIKKNRLKSLMDEYFFKNNVYQGRFIQDEKFSG